MKENTYVTDEDIIIAKCSKVIDSEGNDITKVRGTSVNRGTSGIVDKVVVLKKNDGLRKCKVRIRKEKVPGIGDKFSSRCGQKGMCGMRMCVVGIRGRIKEHLELERKKKN